MRLVSLFIILSLPVGFLPFALRAMPIQKALVKKASPVFEAPAAGLLPSAFIEPADTCTTDSFFVDSANGSAWNRVQLHGKTYWLNGGSLRYLVPSDTIHSAGSASGVSEVDRKRRYKAARENSQWPRRIISAVREGRICLDMREDQVRASWGEPQQIGKSFTLGIGEYLTWFYRNSKGQMLFVNFSDERVIGWYIQKEE